MNRTKLYPLTEVRNFFSDELKNVVEKRQVEVGKEPFDYLVNMLCHYVDSESFFCKNAEGKLENQTLVDLYAEYQKGNTVSQPHTLRRLGDICLIVTGFFSDSLKRKLNDVDYYFGMGGSAYWQLSNIQLSATTRALFKELATKFRTFADVLEEISERSGLQSNSDLLRIYEKWLMTGSDRLKALLVEHGLCVPVKSDFKVKH